MVGIVLVSHSARLADGVAELLRQVAGDEVGIHPVGGGPDGDLGTDPDRIEAAIRGADAGDGVCVLVDVGSSVLSVRALLAEADDDGRVVLADAPLVEGGLAAAVTASTGLDLATVAAAAEEARGARKL